MKIFGKGVFKDPMTGKVIHDFVDGPMVTEDERLIASAKLLGLTQDEEETEELAVPDAPVKSEVIVKRGRRGK